MAANQRWDGRSLETNVTEQYAVQVWPNLRSSAHAHSIFKGFTLSFFNRFKFAFDIYARFALITIYNFSASHFIDSAVF